jgi:hypothetical protein
MNNQMNDSNKSKNEEDESALEKMAKFIDPPSREVSDAELKDPGANTPDSQPRNDDAKRKSPDTK